MEVDSNFSQISVHKVGPVHVISQCIANPGGGARVYVDVTAVFYSQLGRVHTSGRIEHFINFLEIHLGQFRSQVVLVMDGQRPREKQQTHQGGDSHLRKILLEVSRRIEKARRSSSKPKRHYYKGVDDRLSTRRLSWVLN